MAEELSYVIINPYTIYKSRTGGVLARLLTRTSLDLVGAQMFAPSQALIDEYSQNIVTKADPQERHIQEMIRDYVKENLAPDPSTGQRERVMMLLFRGENAVRRIREAVGTFKQDFLGGESIRDTYGDIVHNRDGTLRYFEPAVLASPNVEEARMKLKIWAKYSDSDGGVLEKATATCTDPRHERTLVIIKPDNFKFASGRPGNILDIFSRTGLAITGIKVHRMSVAQAEEFYGPVLAMLREKLGEGVGERAKDLLGSALNLRPVAGTARGRGAVQHHHQVHDRPGAQRSPRRGPHRARHREMHHRDLRGHRRGEEDPRGPRPDRSRQGPERHDPPRVRLDHHGQCRARLRFARQCPPGDGDRQDPPE
jgi:nucleoside diphosphate kinase